MSRSDPAMLAAIGENVRNAAAEHGLDMRRLASHAGLPYTRVQPVWNGEEWPCPRTLRALAHALDLMPAELIPNPMELS